MDLNSVLITLITLSQLNLNEAIKANKYEATSPRINCTDVECNQVEVTTRSTAMATRRGPKGKQQLPDLFIEYIMVLDNDMLQHFDGSKTSATEFADSVIREASGAMKKLNPRLNLVTKDIKTLLNDEKFPGNTLSERLKNFKNYAVKNIYEGDKYDVIQLVVGKAIRTVSEDEFEEGTALGGQLCKPTSVGAVQFQDKTGRNISHFKLARVVAHEMAHIMGLSHNEGYPSSKDCGCPLAEGCIMDSNNNGGLDWSQCSKDRMEQLLTTATTVDFSCLRNNMLTNETSPEVPSDGGKTSPSNGTSSGMRVKSSKSMLVIITLTCFVLLLTMIAVTIFYYVTKNAVEAVQPDTTSLAIHEGELRDSNTYSTE
ncbi:hypothetical protein HDE_12891 [Halotydeus destructor]|nr:hypothetical protein HDE_12891 [Halotydeus destructor]